MDEPAGERRNVAILIADVADSTVMAELLGPERSKFLFDEVVRLMSEEVDRFGGTVAQLTGDGLLALFGAPVAHGDDAERAVRAALAMHESLGNYAAGVASSYGIELAARVAVNTGLVVVPGTDAPPDVLYNALGIPNAGILGIPLIDLDVERFFMPITSSVRSYFVTARPAARRMCRTGPG